MWRATPNPPSFPVIPRWAWLCAVKCINTTHSHVQTWNIEQMFPHVMRFDCSFQWKLIACIWAILASTGNVDWGPVPLNEVSLSSEIPRSPQIVFRGYWQLGKCASYLVNCFPWPKSELIVSKAKMFQVIMWVCGKLKQCTTYCNLLLIVFLALNIESFLDSHLWREWK